MVWITTLDLFKQAIYNTCMDMEIQQVWDKITVIKGKLAYDYIDYDDAKKLAKPLIDKLNERSEVVAKQFGKKHKPFTFTGIFR